MRRVNSIITVFIMLLFIVHMIWGGLLLAGGMKNTLAWKIGSLIPDSRKREFVHHTYMEMVCQRVGQILCGYEDANDCDRLRATAR